MAYYNGTNWTYTWAAGRRLMSAVSGSNTINFSYNEDGSRASKTVNGTRHNYTWDGQTLVRDYYGNTILDFSYDANGQPYAMYYNSTPYFYILNLQGDVIRMVDGNGNTVASYEYDPYGRVISATGSMAEINPLRYRGYYYDQETQLYHLWFRYYDPQTGRFINADSYASTGQGVIGHNMFAYCLNNPVNYTDSDGEMGLAAAAAVGASNAWNPGGWIILAAVGVVACVVIGYQVAKTPAKSPSKTKVLADVKVKTQPNTKQYQLAYVNQWGMLIKVGKKLTFTEALSALGVSGAVNSISKRYTYDKERSSEAERLLKRKGAWGVYANNQGAAKALAVVFGWNAPPEVHGSGMYGHYHDSTRTFHIWFGGMLN